MIKTDLQPRVAECLCTRDVYFEQATASAKTNDKLRAMKSSLAYEGLDGR